MRVELKNQINGKRYAIPDIHGCYQTLVALIDRLKLNPDDQVFFLGDYIDNGPSTKEVVDFIIDLKRQHQVFCIKGNHEAVYEESKLADPYQMKDGAGRFLPKYQKFFDELHYYIELDDFYLVHASINFKAENPFDDYESMLWRSLKTMTTLSDKRIIRGHSKKPLDFIREQVTNRAMVIPLDNGNHRNYAPYGNLCCLELNSFELIVQENLDLPTRLNLNVLVPIE